MGSISISVFFICFKCVHSCLLARVSPRRSIVSALLFLCLFSWLPSPRKIRHRRRQFRGCSNQLAHRRGICGRSRCLESRCHGIPAGPLWTRFLSRFRCLTLIALVSHSRFFSVSPVLDAGIPLSVLRFIPVSLSRSLSLWPSGTSMTCFSPSFQAPVAVSGNARSTNAWGPMSGSTKFFNMSSTFSVHSDLAQGPWEALPSFKDLSSLAVPPFCLPGSSGQNSVPMCTDTLSHLDVSSGQVLAISDVVLSSYLTGSSTRISDPASLSSCAALASRSGISFPVEGSGAPLVLLSPWMVLAPRDILQFPLDHLWNWLASLSPGQDIFDFLLPRLLPSFCSITLVCPREFPLVRSWGWQDLSSSGHYFLGSLFSQRTLSASTIAFNASRRPPVTCVSRSRLGSSFWHGVFCGLWSRLLFSCRSREGLSFGRRPGPTCDVVLRCSVWPGQLFLPRSSVCRAPICSVGPPRTSLTLR